MASGSGSLAGRGFASGDAELSADGRASGGDGGWRATLPGLTVVLLGTLAAAFLADHYGAPITLMALLAGLSLNFLSDDARLHPGLHVASHTLLRCGIVLVGARVTFAQIAALGPEALLAVAAILGLTLASGVLIARRLGHGPAFGVLAGGAVAICGASAAMALATTLGPQRVNRSQLTLTLVGVAAMSAAAMIAYPLVAAWLEMDDLGAGFMLGASIHDVAQALGAGYSFSPDAGRVAAVVKLTRVAMLAPVLALVAALMPAGGRGRAMITLPWYVVGFFVAAGISSTGVVPATVLHGAENLATGMLAAAVTATGIRAPLRDLREAGPGPLLVILAATLVAFAASLLAALFVIQR